jgi:GNAT superfamily N-acetyltransferase
VVGRSLMSVRLWPVREVLPPGVEALRGDARAEGHRFVDRLAEEWAAGVNRFDRPGEVLLWAELDGACVGVGGITVDPAVSGALRMRRFYVRPAHRRTGIGKLLAEALIAPAIARGSAVTVNAGTAEAARFWEAVGFRRSDTAGITHVHPALDPEDGG